MSFFYTSAAGAVDFAALVIVCGIAAVFGTARARFFSAAMAAAFLLHRVLIIGGSLPEMMAIGGLVDFMAALGVLAMVKNRWGRAMAALFSLKIVNYAGVMVGFMTFDVMANSVTVLVYFQLFLILAAAPHDGFWRRIRPYNPAGPTDFSRRRTVARRISDS